MKRELTIIMDDARPHVVAMNDAEMARWHASKALLEACEAMLKDYGFGVGWAYDQGAMEEEERNQCRAIEKQARAAVTKAKKGSV